MKIHPGGFYWAELVLVYPANWGSCYHTAANQRRPDQICRYDVRMSIHTFTKPCKRWMQKNAHSDQPVYLNMRKEVAKLK